jgi:glucosyl-dolichyl phosphate glucuronosyltransferase
MNIENQPTGISIIIPTANRLEDLQDLLNSIKFLKPVQVPCEVIVVDNSKELSARQLVEDTTIPFKLRYLFTSNQGLHHARNKGYSSARYNILAFIDDDVILNENWLVGIFEGFFIQKAHFATGSCLPLFSDTMPKWFESFWPTADHKRREIIHFWPYSVIKFNLENYTRIDPSLVWGCNFIVRKELITYCSGFHPDALPEKKKFYRGDGESYIGNVAKTINAKTIFVENLLIFHKISSKRLNISYLKSRGYNEGITQGYIKHRYNEKKSISKIIFEKIKASYLFIRLMTLPFEAKLALQNLNSGIKEGLSDFEQEIEKSNNLRNWVCLTDYID